MFHVAPLGLAFCGFPAFMLKDLVPVGSFSATLSLAPSQLRPVFREVSARASCNSVLKAAWLRVLNAAVCVCG